MAPECCIIWCHALAGLTCLDRAQMAFGPELEIKLPLANPLDFCLKTLPFMPLKNMELPSFGLELTVFSTILSVQPPCRTKNGCTNGGFNEFSPAAGLLANTTQESPTGPATGSSPKQGPAKGSKLVGVKAMKATSLLETYSAIADHLEVRACMRNGVCAAVAVWPCWGYGTSRASLARSHGERSGRTDWPPFVCSPAMGPVAGGWARAKFFCLPVFHLFTGGCQREEFPQHQARIDAEKKPSVSGV